MMDHRLPGQWPVRQKGDRHRGDSRAGNDTWLSSRRDVEKFRLGRAPFKLQERDGEGVKTVYKNI